MKLTRCRMECLALWLLLALMVCSHASAREIRLQGTVTCKEQGDVGARPAQAVLVVPRQFVSQARLSDDQGLYVFDLPAARIIDQATTLHFRNAGQEIGQRTEQIWESELRRFQDRYVYFPDTAEVEVPCKVAEDTPQVMQQQLALFSQQTEQARVLLDSSAAAGGATVLASLPSVAGAAAGGPALPGGVFSVVGLSPSDAVAGRLSSIALSAKTTAPGFAFAPTRNITDASFWNAAALALSLRRGVNVASDFDEFSRLSLAAGVGDRYGLGIGVIKLKQEDRRTATLDIGTPHTRSFRFSETGVYLSGAARLNRDADRPLAIGITLKHMSQELDLARLGDQVTNLGPDDPTWDYNSVYVSKNDMDVSLNYRVNQHANIGLALMSLLNRKLTDGDGNERDQRAVGLGISIMQGRTHYGVDLIHREVEGSDIALGVNTVPFAHGHISAGYDSTYNNYSVGFGYYWFRYSYSDDDLFNSTHMVGVEYIF
ncbi:hypothetical protein Tel_09005 [Candidatus Tenderia electrophaga]|jgi:hypothetical protein|uniref:Autotransporter domain-containing protein n=1 Tax=Candidatus Tenderia electrophaga TaxID=1748243 RepID=A0A0S2TDS9_9GAMM|nr:hypothetical protein Tel_09005 [Candidatus Tenderia electrophaga]